VIAQEFLNQFAVLLEEHTKILAKQIVSKIQLNHKEHVHKMINVPKKHQQRRKDVLGKFTEKEEDKLVATGLKNAELVHAKKLTELVSGQDQFLSEFQNLDVLGSTEEKEENKSDVVIGPKNALERNAQQQRKSASLQVTILIEKHKIAADGRKLDNSPKEDFAVKKLKFAELRTSVTQEKLNALSKDQFYLDLSL